MSFGMGWKAWQLSKLKRRTTCPRCSLKYAATLARCPHCSELDSAGLVELKLWIEQNQQANARLGKTFVYLALLLVIGLILLNSRA